MPPRQRPAADRPGRQGRERVGDRPDGPSNESGTHASSPNTAAATDTPAHHRQRGDGSEPVGVSSRIKPIQTGIGTMMPAEAAATWAAAGSAPGWATARSSCTHGDAIHDQPRPEDQKQPADRMGWAAAGQHHADRGRAHHRQSRGQAAGVEQGQVGPAGLAQELIEPDDHRPLSITSAHSAQARPASDVSVPPWATWVTVMVLAARGVPRPCHLPASPIACQCDQPPSRSVTDSGTGRRQGRRPRSRRWTGTISSWTASANWPALPGSWEQRIPRPRSGAP